MSNLTRKKLADFKEELRKVNYQIQNLKPYFSRPQVRCWYVYRNSLKEKIRWYEGLIKQEKLKCFNVSEYKQRLIQKAKNEIRTMPGLRPNV